MRSKIVDRIEVARAAVEAKEAGKTVVMTNGCFDILHVGHVRYLQRARTLGDMLIVGVNTDESVRRLKGPDRPVNKEIDRAEVLAALQCVDYVTLFDEDTPIDLIKTVHPDIHAKGGDYVIGDMPEAETVLSIGGQVAIIPFSDTDSESFSTTGTIKVIKGDKTVTL